MSNLLRKQKELIDNQINQTLALNAKYSDYFGSPTFVIYYQIDSEAYKEDQTLETVNSIVGNNTPVKYNKIKDFMIYGIDVLSITNDITERGLNSIIEGEFIIPPNSIRPYADELFIFDIEGLRSHMFKIKSVQQDRLSADKYFRCTFSLWQDNSKIIEDNVKETYSMVDGKNNTVVMKESEVVKAEEIQFAVDHVIKRYNASFYDDENDTYTIRDVESYYWSPYLQQFIHNTKCLDFMKESEYMSQIYQLKLSDREYPGIYQEMIYLDSIFYSIERGWDNINFDMGMMSVVPYNLKDNRNLPFFMSNAKFEIIAPINPSWHKTIYTTGKLFTITSNNRLTEDFNNVDHYHKVHIVDDAHITRLLPYLKDGDLLYHCPENEVWPVAVYKFRTVNNESFLIDLSMDVFFNKDDDEYDEGQELFYFIKQYLKGELRMDEELRDYLYSLRCEPSIYNYIFLPLLLHAIKQQMQLNIKRTV